MTDLTDATQARIEALKAKYNFPFTSYRGSALAAVIDQAVQIVADGFAEQARPLPDRSGYTELNQLAWDCRHGEPISRDNICGICARAMAEIRALRAQLSASQRVVEAAKALSEAMERTESIELHEYQPVDDQWLELANALEVLAAGEKQGENDAKQ